MNFKKGLLFTVLCAVIAFSAMAESKGGHTKADISYTNVPVYKIFDSRDYYVVLYGKYGAKMGTVTIPKAWAKWQKDEPRKLTFRDLPAKIGPYMTIVKKDNEFLKVILTVPVNHNDRLWGVINENKVDRSEKSTIEIELR